MEYEEYIRLGLSGDAPLKLILCGSVQNARDSNIKAGVVSVVFATNDRALAEEKIRELTAANPNSYYMVYSVPLDTDLTKLPHYPSIEIAKSDLQ